MVLNCARTGGREGLRVIWQKDQRELALAHVLAVVQAVRHLASDFYLPEPQLPTL